jgi:hypothetical protein
MNEKNDGNQAQRFHEAARAAECDEDEARWEARLKRVVKRKPKGTPTGEDR